jgi:hypothetical protein
MLHVGVYIAAWVVSALGFPERMLLDVMSLRGRIVSRLLRYGAHASELGSALPDVAATMASWKYRALSSGVSNPHEEEAGIRKNATKYIFGLLKRLELRAYQIQQGDRGRGTGMFIDPIDYTAVPTRPKADDAFVLIDSDYYVDMARVLDSFRLTVLYTFCPTRAAGVGRGYQFSITDNVVSYQSPSGYVCSHQIWAYPADYLRVYGPGWWIFRDVSWFRVKKLAFPHDRQVVVLIPWFKLPWWLGPLRAIVTREDSALRRFRYTYAKVFTAFQTWIGNQLSVTVALNNSNSAHESYDWQVFGRCVNQTARIGAAKLPNHNAVTLTQTEYPDLMCMLANAALTAGPMDVVHTGYPVGHYTDEELEAEKEKGRQKPRVKCGCDLHTTHGDKTKPEGVVYTTGESREQPRCGVTPVGPDPLVDEHNEVSSPSRTREGLNHGLDKRVVEVQDAAKKRVKPHALGPKFAEFVTYLQSRHIIPTSPLSDEEAMSRVPGPNRERMTSALPVSFTKDSKKPRPFVKAECYTELKDERIITPLAEEVQSKLYKYSYALQDALHGAAWFAFGQPLSSVADRVAYLTTRRNTVLIETDFSRFDGSITVYMRQLEAMIYAAAFPNDPHVLKIHQNTYDLNLGRGRRSGGARASGSPDTCVMNSLLNAFMFFNAIGPEFEDMVVVGGDDGLAALPASLVSLVEQSAKDCGFMLKLTRCDKTVSFLGRIFSRGSPNSICDVERTVPKIHIVNRVVPSKWYHSAYKLKLEALLTNDASTPIIGDYLRAQLWRVVLAPDLPEAFKDIPWPIKAGMPYAGAWPNRQEDWMWDYILQRVNKLPAGVLEAHHGPRPKALGARPP